MTKPPPPPPIPPISDTEFMEFSVGPEKEFVLQIDLLRNIKSGKPVWYEGSLLWLSTGLSESAEGESSTIVLRELMTKLGNFLKEKPARK